MVPRVVLKFDSHIALRSSAHITFLDIANILCVWNCTQNYKLQVYFDIIQWFMTPMQ